MKKAWLIILAVILGAFVCIGAIFGFQKILVGAGAKNTVEKTYSDDELFSFSKDGLFGYMDRLGNVVIKPQFQFVCEFHEGLASVSKSWGKMGYINTKGKLVIPYRYGCALDFQDGRAKVSFDEIKDPNIYIDKKGNFLYPIHFRNAGDFCDGFAAVSVVSLNPIVEDIDNDYTDVEYKYDAYPEVYHFYINEKGKRVSDLDYDGVSDFENGYAVVRKNDKCGLIDKNFKLVIDYQNNIIEDVTNGLIVVNNGNGKEGVINLKNETVVDMKYDQIMGIKDGIIPVEEGNKWGLFNEKGEVVTNCQYDWIGDISEGLIPVRKNNREGFINEKGKVIIDFKYDGVGSFYDNLATVCINNKWGYINKKGKIIVPCKFANISDFSEGVATVEASDGKWGVINSNGKCIVKPQYEYIEPCEHGLMLAGDKGCAVFPESDQFYITKTGKIVKPH